MAEARQQALAEGRRGAAAHHVVRERRVRRQQGDDRHEADPMNGLAFDHGVSPSRQRRPIPEPACYRAHPVRQSHARRRAG
jgi:hypothetical protein